MEEFPNNSRVAKSVPTTEKEADRPRVEKVGTGRAVIRKKPLGRRLAEMFFGSDDARGVFNYVTQDVLIPAAKDMFMDAVSGGVERAVYGEVRGRGRGTRGSGSNNYVPYNRYTSGSTGPAQEAPREISRRGRTRHDFSEIVFPSHAEAMDVLNELHSCIKQFGSATVADLYEAAQISGHFVDENFGWEDLGDADVVRRRGGGYILDLPQTIKL